MDWNRLLSRVRLGLSRPHPDSEARTDFQRDFDRIVFSSAFRRLQDKTQVFPLSQSDYVRTRLTHSLEVSSVGRSLGTMVGDSVIKRHGLKGVYPQDFGAVVAAACLAHDIGNPPFGHAGEDAIRLWFTTSATGLALLDALTNWQRADFLRFEGNAQGFRIITRLQSPDNRGGMQLTCATVGTFTKYPRAAWLPADPPPGIAFRKFGFYQDDEGLFAEVASQLGLESIQAGAWSRHPLAYLVEAADDICYRIIDVEDAFRLQQLRFEDVQALLLPLTGDPERARRKMAHITRPKERPLRLAPLVAEELLRPAVVDPLEVGARADRPGRGRAGDPEDLLDLVHQVERVAAGTVQLVHERRDRDLPHPADLEELDRLRLDPLRRVNEHDGAVGGGEGPVGVLAEVVVPRRVE